LNWSTSRSSSSEGFEPESSSTGGTSASNSRALMMMKARSFKRMVSMRAPEGRLDGLAHAKALVFRTQRLVNRTRRAGVDMDQGTGFEPGDRGIDLYQHRFRVSRSMSAARGCREDRHEFSPENDGTHHRGVGTTVSLTQKFAACGAASRFTVAGLTVMANAYVDTRAPPDLSAGGGRLSARSEGCGVGAAGAADPAGIARRAFAQDRAGGDELHFIP